MNTIDVNEAELAIIKNILDRAVPELAVYAFGSRVNSNARKSSDLDLVLMNQKPFEIKKIIELKDAFRESDLPFKVDIVEWAGISESFREIIKRNYVLLKNAQLELPGRGS
jgi:predicted nucleotidyltransferase